MARALCFSELMSTMEPGLLVMKAEPKSALYISRREERGPHVSLVKKKVGSRAKRERTSGQVEMYSHDCWQ